MCSCFDCLRAQGITDPERADCMGKYRDRADGRYLRGFTTVKDGDKTVTVESGKRESYIGT